MMMTVKYAEVQGDQLLKVHSAAIHIEHKATLTQQKMWLFLLYSAYHRLNERIVHEVELPAVRRFLGTKMTGTNEFKDMLKALIGITLEWNIFEKDSEKWEAMPLLSYCAIEKRGGQNIIRYRYTEELSDRLYDPEMYVKINLLISQNFRGKHAFNLYLLALDYLQVKKGFGYKHLTVAEIRKYLGIQPGDYAAVYDLKRYVLWPAVKEINEKSDIHLEIIDLPLNSKGAKITGFRLEMRVKKGFWPGEQALESGSDPAAEPEPIVYQFPEAVARFHAKYDVDVYAKPFIAAFENAKSQLLEQIDDYLISTVDKVKKKEAFLTNVAGFYISQLDDEALILGFKRQIKTKAEEKASEAQLKEIMAEEELNKSYREADRRKFLEYIVERLDTLMPLLSQLIEGNLNNFERTILKTKFNNQINAEYLKKPGVYVPLYEFREEIGYTPLDEMSWKEAYGKHPAM